MTDKKDDQSADNTTTTEDSDEIAKAKEKISEFITLVKGMMEKRKAKESGSPESQPAESKAKYRSKVELHSLDGSDMSNKEKIEVQVENLRQLLQHTAMTSMSFIGVGSLRTLCMGSVTSLLGAALNIAELATDQIEPVKIDKPADPNYDDPSEVFMWTFRDLVASLIKAIDENLDNGGHKRSPKADSPQPSAVSQEGETKPEIAMPEEFRKANPNSPWGRC
jgi:hypothetical protein